MEQTEESWDDIFMKYRTFTNNEDSYSFKEWMKENYYSPISKDIVQEKMYSKQEIIETLTHFENDYNISKDYNERVELKKKWIDKHLK